MAYLLFFYVLLGFFNFCKSDLSPLCEKRECVHYRVLKKTSKYEVREYDYDVPNRMGLSIFTDDGEPQIDGCVAEKRLQRNVLNAYMHGNNEKKMNISNVLPVMDFYQFYHNFTTMCVTASVLFFPKSMVSPPRPLEKAKTMELKESGKMRYYAVTLEGSPSPIDVHLAAAKLQEDLIAEGVYWSVEVLNFFTAKYTLKLDTKPEKIDVMLQYGNQNLFKRSGRQMDRDEN